LQSHPGIERGIRDCFHYLFLVEQQRLKGFEMKRRLLVIFFWSMGLSICTVSARADFDFSPGWSGNVGDRIVMHGYDDNVGAATPEEIRVFDFDFRPDGGDPFPAPVPNSASDPGFHPEVNSGLPNGTTMTFEILSDLQFWNGAGFEPVPNGEVLTMTLGSTLVSIGTGGTYPLAAAHNVGTIGSDGNQSLHVHVTTGLHSQPGNNDPTDGVYMFEMDIRLLNGDNTPYTAAGTTLPFVVLWDHNSPDGTIDEAHDYAQANLVPEPATYVLAGLGGLAFAGAYMRRRVFTR
jgi:hypothetical protein